MFPMKHAGTMISVCGGLTMKQTYLPQLLLRSSMFKCTAKFNHFEFSVIDLESTNVYQAMIFLHHEISEEYEIDLLQSVCNITIQKIGKNDV